MGKVIFQTAKNDVEPGTDPYQTSIAVFQKLADEHPEWGRLHWNLGVEVHDDGKAQYCITVTNSSAISRGTIAWVVFIIVIGLLLTFAS